jgi:hypothetical protein
VLAYQTELGTGMSVIVTTETDEDVTVVPDGLVPQTVDTEIGVAEIGCGGQGSGARSVALDAPQDRV